MSHGFADWPLAVPDAPVVTVMAPSLLMVTPVTARPALRMTSIARLTSRGFQFHFPTDIREHELAGVMRFVRQDVPGAAITRADWRCLEAGGRITLIRVAVQTSEKTALIFLSLSCGFASPRINSAAPWPAARAASSISSTICISSALSVRAPEPEVAPLPIFLLYRVTRGGSA